jgi:hypothetical protein
MPSKKGAISETINISPIYAVHLTHARFLMGKFTKRVSIRKCHARPRSATRGVALCTISRFFNFKQSMQKLNSRAASRKCHARPRSAL